jgi:hypothetical protein
MAACRIQQLRIYAVDLFSEGVTCISFRGLRDGERAPRSLASRCPRSLAGWGRASSKNFDLQEGTVRAGNGHHPWLWPCLLLKEETRCAFSRVLRPCRAFWHVPRHRGEGRNTRGGGGVEIVLAGFSEQEVGLI